MKGNCVHGFEESILLKCSSYSKWFIDHCNSYQNANDIFVGYKTENILKFTWVHKVLRLAKGILYKKSNMGSIALADCKIYYDTFIIKTQHYCHKYKPPKTKEQNRKSRLKCTHVQLVDIWWSCRPSIREILGFPVNVAGNVGQPHAEVKKQNKTKHKTTLLCFVSCKNEAKEKG